MKIFKRKQQSCSRRQQQIIPKGSLAGQKKGEKIKMGRLAVNGGNQLYGDIASGAKNAALPLLAAGLMSAGGLA